MERKQMHYVVHDAKQINTLELANMDFPLLYLPNNMWLNIQSRKGGSKKFKSSV
jgi:hypothetical protein